MSEQHKADDGGQAFPNDWTVAMSLRDWFAGQALLGMAAARDFMNELASISATKDEALENLARWSYKAADAMLALRKSPPQETGEKK